MFRRFLWLVIAAALLVLGTHEAPQVILKVDSCIKSNCMRCPQWDQKCIQNDYQFKDCLYSGRYAECVDGQAQYKSADPTDIYPNNMVICTSKCSLPSNNTNTSDIFYTYIQQCRYGCETLGEPLPLMQNPQVKSKFEQCIASCPTDNSTEFTNQTYKFNTTVMGNCPEVLRSYQGLYPSENITYNVNACLNVCQIKPEDQGSSFKKYFKCLVKCEDSLSNQGIRVALLLINIVWVILLLALE